MSEVTAAAADAETRLQTILKAVVVGAEERTPTSLTGGEEASELRRVARLPPLRRAVTGGRR